MEWLKEEMGKEKTSPVLPSEVIHVNSILRFCFVSKLSLLKVPIITLNIMFILIYVVSDLSSPNFTILYLYNTV